MQLPTEGPLMRCAAYGIVSHLLGIPESCCSYCSKIKEFLRKNLLYFYPSLSFKHILYRMQNKNIEALDL
jgi:hypothetical protein